MEGVALKMGFRDPKLEDRQQAALDAKKALLEKFKSQPGPGHPEYEAKKKEREAVIAARAEREAAKVAEQQEKERLAELARQEAARRLQEELDRKDRERIEREEREEEEEAQKKAERDAKYAARKARRQEALRLSFIFTGRTRPGMLPDGVTPSSTAPIRR